MVRIYIYIYIYISFHLLPHFYLLLLSPLSQSSASFNSFTRRRPKPLPNIDNTDPSLCLAPTTPTQAPAPRRQCQLISSLSAPISLLSHFSYTLSLNLSPSQTPRPMIADRGWVRCRNGLWVVSVPKRLMLFFPYLHSVAGFVSGLLGSWCMVVVWVSLDCISGF